jgi:hypothetical protein
MWDIHTLWFDTAVVLGIFTVGNILFRHFEEHKPKWRRLIKVAIVLIVILSLSATVGRAWAFGVLALPLLVAAYVHLWWLPSYGISGWTGEPRERYLALVTRRRSHSGLRQE